MLTGGGAGIGKAICLMFAKAGADIACTDLNEADAEQVAEECSKQGVKTAGLKLNVTDESERQATVERIVSDFGRLTILVNNAGGGGPKPFDMPLKEFEWAYQLNVFSMFRLSQLAHVHMKTAGGGAIVNISSMAGQNTNKRMSLLGPSFNAPRSNPLTPPFAISIRVPSFNSRGPAETSKPPSSLSFLNPR